MSFRTTAFAAVAVACALTAPAHAAVNLLSNGGFEDAALGTGGYYYPTHGSTVDGWYYYGPAIVNGTGGSAWWPNDPQPTGFEGDNFVALQSTSVLAQNFTLASGGRVDISWLAGGRPFSYGGCCNGDQTYRVTVYNYGTQAFSDVGQFSTVSGEAFGAKSGSVNLAGGNYALIFQGLTNRDETSFIDNVSASMAVPEPAAWALMIIGFGAAGAMLRRRRAVVA